MSTENRFLKSVLKSAKTEETSLPWQRGARRAQFISRRNTPQPEKKSA